MAKKPKLEELLQAYVEGRLEADQRAAMERLIESDENVREMHRLIAALHRESREAADLRKAAKGLVQRFLRDFQRNRKNTLGSHGLLTFDSGLLPLPAGIRPATIDSRRLKYTAGDHELEVSMYPGSPGTYEIIGQISGFPTGVILDVRLEHHRHEFTAAANEFQVFHFVRVPAGEYTLLVNGPEKTSFSFVLEV